MAQTVDAANTINYDEDCLLTSVGEDFESLDTSRKHLAWTIVRVLKWMAYTVISEVEMGTCL